MGQRHDESEGGRGTGVMRKELFGVFGSHETFTRHRSEDAFDLVVSGEAVTVGIRDPWAGIQGRTAVNEGDSGLGVVWGEAFAPEADSAQWLRTEYQNEGTDALAGLNGSYVAVLEHDGTAMVAVDPIRSRDCFYADVDGTRCFGTDCAALARLESRPRVDREALLEFLHLSFVTGNQTLFEGVFRIPFDGYVTPGGTGTFKRFTYNERSFDYVGELANRLRRAIGRRADYPGMKGLLLSAGQDSRSFLATVDIDRCYTIGYPGSQEVKIARLLAEQYGAAHTTVEPDARYLVADGEKVRYTNGIRESIHAHQAGYGDRIDADVMYHGLLYDTLFKGYFLERAGVELSDQKFRLKRPATDVDPVATLLDTLGYGPEGSRRLANCPAAVFTGENGLGEEFSLEVGDPRAFLEERIDAELDRLGARTETVHDTVDAFAIKHQPAMPFRTHISDNYIESFVAADAELVDWHLQTPPRHRHPDTVGEALAALDSDVFRHRPPGRPRRSELLNQLERFARRMLPFRKPLEPAWPDYAEIYGAYDLDDLLFPDSDDVRGLPVRYKLRVRDARWWLSECRATEDR